MTTATLKPATHESYQDGDFIVHENVPYFYEHEGPDGTVYTRDVLKGMVATMNQRIRDKNNYCPLVAGHRPQGDEKKHKDEPEVIGFIGPYHLGMFGNEDPEWCIFGTERIFKSDADRAKKLPRRSVEVWPVSDPKKRYFDPIAALGAETPNLDLGIVYQRGERGMVPHRYEVPAAIPGGSNVYIPDLGKKRKAHQYDLESQDMNTPPDVGGAGVGPSLTQSDLQQIAQMVDQLIETKLAQLMAPIDDEPQGPGDGSLPPPAEPPPDNKPDGSMPGEPQEPPPGTPPAKKKPADQYAKKHYEAVCQYAMKDDADGACQYMEGLDESGMNEVAEQYEKETDKDKKSKLKSILEPHSMSENTTAQQYAKQNADLQAEVQQYKKDNVALQERLAILEKSDTDRKQEAVKAIRYSKCSELRNVEGFNIDVGKSTDEKPTEDMEFVLGMSDEQFDKWHKRVPHTYARVPIKSRLLHEPPQANPLDDDKGAERRKKAMKLVQESGNKIDFNQALVMADAS